MSESSEMPMMDEPEARTQQKSPTKPKQWMRLLQGVRKIKEQIDLGLDFTTRRVLSGEKPGALVGIRNPKFYEKYALEAVHLKDTKGNETDGVMICLRGKKAQDVIKTKEEKGELPQIPEIQPKIDALFEKLKTEDTSVAQALADLYYMPRNGSTELPEVAVVEGTLFGYKKCNVEYAVSASLNLVKPYAGYNFSGAANGGELLCPDCYKGKPK